MTTSSSRVLKLIAVLALGGLCFVTGRLSIAAPKPAPAARCEAGPEPVALARALRREQPVDEPQPRMPLRSITVEPVHLTQAPSEQAAEELRAYEAKQSRELVGLLRGRIRTAAMMSANPNDPQHLLQYTDDYLAGWADGLVRTAPTLADDLAQEIENALCDPSTPAVEVMLYARLGRMMPELTSATGFECVLSTGITEGPVLWETLGTLNASGLPAPKSLAAIDARAKDERTLRLLHPERELVPAETPEPESDEPQPSAEEIRALHQSMLAERSQGLQPLPPAPERANHP